MYDWKKSVAKGVKIAVGALVVHSAAAGFDLTALQQNWLIDVGIGAFASLANTLKHKWPETFYWL